MVNLNNFLNRNIGLTLVEVLASVIITTLLMLYGTSFFIAAWRLSAESDEYSMILNDVVSNLESYKSKSYNSAVTGAGVYVVQQKVLRNQYTVNYTLSKSADVTNNFIYVTSKAEWSYGQGEESINRISIKSAIAPRWNKIS